MCFNVVTIVLTCTCDVTTPLTVHVMPIVQCATAESANPSEPREKNTITLWQWGSRDHLRLAVLLQPIDGTTGERLKIC